VVANGYDASVLGRKECNKSLMHSMFSKLI